MVKFGCDIPPRQCREIGPICSRIPEAISGSVGISGADSLAGPDQPGERRVLGAARPTVTTAITANATPTLGIFVVGGAAVPDSPSVNRVFARFRDSGQHSARRHLRHGAHAVRGGRW